MIVIIFAVFIVSRLLMAAKIKKQLTADLLNRDWESYSKHMNSLPAHSYISAYNRAFLNVQACMLKGDEKGLKDAYNALLSTKMNDAQAKNAYILALNYYISEENNKARDILEKLKKIADPREYHPYEILLSVYLDHETKYMDEVKHLIDETEGVERGQYHQLLALMYGYQGNKEKEKEEQELADKDLPNPVKENADTD